MNREQKQKIVVKLVQDLQDSHFYIANSEGLSAQQANQVRRECFKANIQYQVIKNTLLIKALQQINHPQLDLKTLQQKALKGSTALLITKETPSQPANILRTFHKQTKLTKPQLKAAFVYDELYIGSQHLKALTQLKSKQQLIAEIIQLLQTPTQNLLSALQNTGDKLTKTLKALTKK